MYEPHTSNVNIFPSGPPMNPISSLSMAKEEVRKRGRGSIPRGKHHITSDWSSRISSTLYKRGGEGVRGKEVKDEVGMRGAYPLNCPAMSM